MYVRDNGRRRGGWLMREKVHACSFWERMKSSECSMPNGHQKKDKIDTNMTSLQGSNEVAPFYVGDFLLCL